MMGEWRKFEITLAENERENKLTDESFPAIPFARNFPSQILYFEAFLVKISVQIKLQESSQTI